MSDQDWTHAFDGLTIEGDEDLGEALRGAMPTPSIERLFKPVAERIMELSKAVLEVGSGWAATEDTPTDTGVATPDVQFVAVPIPVEGRIQVVYGPFEDGGRAVEVAQGLSSDPDECYVVPVVSWES